MDPELETIVNEMRSIDGRIRAVYDATRADGRQELTDDEQQQVDTLIAALLRHEDKLLQGGGEPPTDLIINQRNGRRTEPGNLASARIGNAGGAGRTLAPARPKSGDNPRLFMNLFPDVEASSDGWRDDAEFWRTLGRRVSDPRFRAAAGQQEGVGEDGGFAVPTAFLGFILDSSLESEIVRPRARVVPAPSNIVEIPAWDDLDHTGGSIAGFDAVWLGEAAQGTRQKAKLRPLSMRVNKLAIFATATSELLEDAAMFASEFRAKLIEAITWGLDDAFLNGTGNGQPLGVLNSPSLVVVDKETASPSQAADTINYRNLKKIFARMHPASRSRAVWVAHTDCIPELMELFATDGTSSTHVPVLQEGGETGFRIFTRPVFFTEKVPALGNQGDIGLYDFSRYVIAMRRNASTQVEIGPGWLTDEVDFRTILRAQGQDSWNKAFQPKTGNTLGWAVTLAERA